MLALLLQVATIPDSADLMRAAFKRAYATRYSNDGMCVRLAEKSTGEAIRDLRLGLDQFFAKAGFRPPSDPKPTRMDLAYQRIGNGEEERHAAPDILKALSGLYPAGSKTCRQTWEVSRPAFIGGFGFVSIDMHCGAMCGKGGFYAFEYVRGRWKFAGTPYFWVS